MNSSPDTRDLEFTGKQRRRMQEIKKEKKRLQEEMDRVTKKIQRIRRRKERRGEKRSRNVTLPLVMPNWEQLSPATFPITSGAINLLVQYPKLDAWVKRTVDEAVERLLKTRKAGDILEPMRRVRDRLMSAISTVCRRRRSTFKNSIEYQRAKIENRRGIAVRFSAATRGISEIRLNQPNTLLQRDLDGLVHLRNMEVSF